jgi:hypothetical protein
VRGRDAGSANAPRSAADDEEVVVKFGGHERAPGLRRSCDMGAARLSPNPGRHWRELVTAVREPAR